MKAKTNHAATAEPASAILFACPMYSHPLGTSQADDAGRSSTFGTRATDRKDTGEKA